jgi:hypothetical protein
VPIQHTPARLPGRPAPGRRDRRCRRPADRRNRAAMTEAELFDPAYNPNAPTWPGDAAPSPSPSAP